MDIIIKQLTLNVTVGDANVANSVFDQLTKLNKKADQIMATQQDELDALKLIDDATTAIGTNVDAIKTTNDAVGTVVGQVATEMTALQKQLADALAAGNGVPDSVMTTLAGINTRLAAAQSGTQTISVALAANKTALDAIATQGAGNPVPVVPPPPPPPPSIG